MSAFSIRNFACLAALAFLALAAQSEWRAYAQSDAGDKSVFDVVDECDLLAAHPSDPQRTAEGVADDGIIPRLAIAACEAAVKRAPSEARFIFQLGRAQLAAGKHEEAFRLFAKAAGPLLEGANAKPDARSSAAAHGYLGDAYLFGQGTKADLDKARQHYESATRGGFEPAKKQIEITSFNPKQYVYGSVLKAIAAGQFDEVKAKASEEASAPLRAYLHSLVLKLIDECDSFLAPEGLVGLFRFRYPDGWSADAEASQTNVGNMAAIGELDAASFAKKYGCEGPIAKQMLDGINLLFVGLYNSGR
jgi:TPR repeat protein